MWDRQRTTTTATTTAATTDRFTFRFWAHWERFKCLNCFDDSKFTINLCQFNKTETDSNQKKDGIYSKKTMIFLWIVCWIFSYSSHLHRSQTHMPFLIHTRALCARAHSIIIICYMIEINRAAYFKTKIFHFDYRHLFPLQFDCWAHNSHPKCLIHFNGNQTIK